MRAPLYASLALVAAGGLVACLPPAGGPMDDPPMCEVTSDCAGDGEVCEEGICWGDPPDADYAAALTGPEGSVTLVPTDLPSIAIARDGEIVGLDFSDFVTLSGRVVLSCDDPDNRTLCDSTDSVAARITVTRPSRIPGAPDYVRTLIASPGVAAGGTAFELRLPPIQEGETPYAITVRPDDGNLGVATYVNASPAEMAPPINFELAATQDASVEWTLGSAASHKIVTGRVVDAAARGLEGMRVWALGRWTEGDPLERGSSIATTDAEGNFVLRIPIAMQDQFELLARPGPEMIAPTLRAGGIVIPDPVEPSQPIEVADLRMPSFAEPVTFKLPVRGTGSDGSTTPVSGAEVTVVTTLVEDEATEATFTSTASTDSEGNVDLSLIPGGLLENRVYTITVKPSSSSQHAPIFDAEISIPGGSSSGDSWLETLVLSRRVPVRGLVLSPAGEPVAGATVRAQLSLGFLLSLDSAVQEQITSSFDRTGLTDDEGKFLLWLDPQLAGAVAAYDFDIIPPAGSALPRWSKRGITIAASQIAGVDLEPLEMPEAAYARGTVSSRNGSPVDGAEVRIYELVDDGDVCGVTELPDGTECVPPPLLRGVFTTDEDGIVRVVVPDP